MEARLRRRVESLVAISNNSIRNIEHRTFRRLLYRNRNQHRHGFYFRKLDHVRRLLIRIDGHIAWESLQYSLGDSDSGIGRANVPLSVSSLTVSDLDSVEKQLDKLVTTVIIDAARRVMTDLVCREHFFPFAVSVLASLARLFVLERKVLSEVRGVRTEMNLLFATECSTVPPQDNKAPSAQAANEDIGLEMCAQKEPKSAGLLRTQQAEILGNQTDFPEPPSIGANTVKPPEGNDVQLPKRSTTESREPSLYQVVAKHVDTTKFSVEFRNRISVSLPQVLVNAHQKNSEENNGKALLNGTSTTKALTIQGDSIVSNKEPKAAERCATESDLANDTGISNQRQCSRDDENYRLDTKASADASDSDDIDDIFDALDDT